MRLIVLKFDAFVNREDFPSFSKDLNNDDKKNYNLPQFEVPEIYNAEQIR